MNLTTKPPEIVIDSISDEIKLPKLLFQKAAEIAFLKNKYFVPFCSEQHPVILVSVRVMNDWEQRSYEDEKDLRVSLNFADSVHGDSRSMNFHALCMTIHPDLISGLHVWHKVHYANLLGYLCHEAGEYLYRGMNVYSHSLLHKMDKKYFGRKFTTRETGITYSMPSSTELLAHAEEVKLLLDELKKGDCNGSV